MRSVDIKCCKKINVCNLLLNILLIEIKFQIKIELKKIKQLVILLFVEFSVQVNEKITALLASIVQIIL